MEKYKITTQDNPFNPFTQWDDWYFYDMSQGYNTCERLARLVKTSSQLPEETIDSELEFAFDQLMFEGAFSKQGLYTKYILVKNPEYKGD